MSKMLEFKQGNLLEENAEALVNAVNCVGVMGKGIALQFKQAFPENFQQYKKACNAKEVQPGRMFAVPTGNYSIQNTLSTFLPNATGETSQKSKIFRLDLKRL